MTRRVALEVQERDGRFSAPLKAQSEAADLVVVGSSGLQEPTSLGSVSERVAHRASCLVLVVRRSAPG